MKYEYDRSGNQYYYFIISNHHSHYPHSINGLCALLGYQFSFRANKEYIFFYFNFRFSIWDRTTNQLIDNKIKSVTLS